MGVESSYKVEPGTPAFYYLSGVVAPGWVIRRPMKIWIERDEAGDYVATHEQLSIYGEGKDWSAAIDDYVSSLIEYYELIEREARDHQPSAYYLRRIQHYIAKTKV